MKIDRDSKNTINYGPLGKTITPGVKKVGESLFDQELTGRREGEHQFRMQELLKELDRLTERLSRHLTVNDLMLYKRLVKNFLQEATSRAYLLEKQRSRNRRGRTVLVTIKTIDKEVEELINDFIQQKKEPLELLDALDKIRGMLVDLMI